MQRGCSVIIVDNGMENASRVAAGLINPVTDMRLVKSTDTGILRTTARSCYSYLEDFFHKEFFKVKPMIRIFRSQKELYEAEMRIENPDYQDYITNIHSQEYHIGNLATLFG